MLMRMANDQNESKKKNAQEVGNMGRKKFPLLAKIF